MKVGELVAYNKAIRGMEDFIGVVLETYTDSVLVQWTSKPEPEEVPKMFIILFTEERA